MSPAEKAPSILIRNFEPKDRQRLRDISCATAFKGALPGRSRIDCNLLADLLTLYYTDCEPESILTAESEGRVIGYIMGAVSTRRFSRKVFRLFLSTVIPKLLLGRYRVNKQLLLLLLVLFAITITGDRDPDLEKEYPAHLHIDIDDNYQKAGLGFRLMSAWLQYITKRRVKGVHLSTNSNNEGAIRFFERFGFRLCHRRRSVFWSFVLNRPVYIEIFALKLS